MEILYFFESIRIPVLNELMLLITRLGEETALLVVALIVFWCVDKRHGYYILGVGLLGTIANQVLKLLCRVPRPWVLDKNLTILEEAREAATGYSFPSGHTQTAVGTFGALAVTSKQKILRTICIVIAVLVPISRMYVGVHTLLDVAVGAAMALALVFLVEKVVYSQNGKYIPVMLMVMLGVSVVFLLFVELCPFPADMDEDNLASGIKNAYTMLGCTAGLLICYVLDKKYIRFSVQAAWWVQVLKVVLGLAAVLLVKEGLRSPLDSLFAGHMTARAVRYFLIVVVAGAVWPLSFRKLARLGKIKKGE